MSQTVKNLIIRLTGQTDSSADSIRQKLSEIGQALQIIGGYTSELQKESVDVYRTYEDAMLDARGALSAQIESATQLDNVMAGLDEAARKWASNSIFHTDDVSQAIAEAAHAGWSYEQILEGIPRAMMIAQAGGMDLSEGLDYLVKMMNTTNTSFDDVETVVNQWAKAANLSATNVGELGEAFMSLSASAMFGDSTEELFAMLAVLANAGVTGAKAGTMLRTAMMRMVAPTKAAKTAMQSLGATEEELAEWSEEDEMVGQLEALGFSAYDAYGRLKPMKEIFTSLHDSLKGMTEQERYDVLSKMFPLRSINAATAFYNSIESGHFDELFTNIGDSEGYAAKVSDIMMSGLTGSIETLASKWEEFERTIGEQMAPGIEAIAGGLGTILDFMNGLDEPILAGITSMLTALSAAGALAGGAAAVAKLFALLGPVGAAALIAGSGVGFLVGYLDKLNELQFEEKFGTLKVDLQDLNDYVAGIETKFDTESSAITRYSEAVTAARQNFESATNEMNEGLLKKILTGGTFTEEDYEAYSKMGSNIRNAVLSGLESAEGRDKTFLEALFGGDGTAESTEAQQTGEALLTTYYGDLEEEAYLIGERIRDQLTAALANGELTEEDRAAIQAQVDRYNRIMSEIEDRKRAQAYYKQQARAGRVSYDTIGAFLESNAAVQAEQEAALGDQYDELVAALMAAEASARERGIDFIEYNGERVSLTEVGPDGMTAVQRMYAQIERERTEALAELRSKYGTVSNVAFSALMGDNFGDAWDVLKRVYAGEELGNIFAGMTGEQQANVWDQLSAMGSEVNRFKSILNPFASDPAVYAMMRALETLGEEDVADRWNMLMENAANDAWLNQQMEEFGIDMPVELTVDDTEVESYEPPVKTGVVKYAGGILFASGGRATEASIFGEAGPEWAIPEEHSERTAALLNAARQASGFSWGELLGRYGGLNARAGNNPVVLNYSPVIHAGDANGVAEALAANRDAVMKMIRKAMEEAEFRDGAVRYA